MWKCKRFWPINRAAKERFITAKNTQGYLLMEILLALPMLVILAATTLSICWLGLQVYQRQASQCEVQYFSRSALNTLDSDIKQGKNFEVLSGNRLEIMTHQNKYLIYYLENKQIYRAEYRQEPYGRVFVNSAPICESIETMTFQMMSPELVAVHIESGYREAQFSLVTASRTTRE